MCVCISAYNLTDQCVHYDNAEIDLLVQQFNCKYTEKSIISVEAAVIVVVGLFKSFAFRYCHYPSCDLHQIIELLGFCSSCNEIEMVSCVLNDKVDELMNAGDDCMVTVLCASVITKTRSERAILIV